MIIIMRYTVCAFFEVLRFARMSIIERRLSADRWTINDKQIASLANV